jgi:restriction system protein
MNQYFGQYVNPVLSALKRLGGSGRPKEVCAAVAREMGLEGSPMLKETLKSGVTKFENRIAWVRQYLVRTGYIDDSQRGVWVLTEKGTNAPTLTDEQIDKLLIEGGVRGKHATGTGQGQATEQATTGDEEAEPAESDYKAQLLDIIRKLPPSGFERLCQRLLREAGFEQVEVTGRTGDGGIDGIGVLRVNPFVSFKVVFQCKRYSATVGSPQLRDFRGAMQGRAEKGIFMTTGSFSDSAQEEAARPGVPPIELVDAEQLVELFEKLGLGLTPRKAYDVQPSFFAEYQQQ